MEISLGSTSSGAASADRPVEGRIESVEDGVAKVRISVSKVVSAVLESGMDVGAKVALFVGADGKLVAHSTTQVATDAQARMLKILMESLPAMVGEKGTETVAKSLARQDFEAARRQIAGIWQEIRGKSPGQLDPELGAWLERGMPALLSREGDAPIVQGGAVALTLGSSGKNDGEYAALIAGRSATLLGPPDLPQGPKGLWQTRQIPGGGAVWAPLPQARLEAPARALPERVAPTTEGAKALLDWAGVDVTPESMESLGRFLESVAREFADPDRGIPESDHREQAIGDAPARATPGKAPDAAPIGPVPTPSGTKALPDLPQSVAQRALVAWSLELPDEPTVRRAVLGDAPTLPEAVERLARILQAAPDADPILAVAVRNWTEAHRIDAQGIGEHRQNPASREAIAQAVFEALAKTADSQEHAPLREALRQTASALVQESLEPPRDRSQEPPPGLFHARAPDGRLEEGRIVVHDRRSRKGGDANDSDHHFVEIEMRPGELGFVKARLDLRGKVLTTRLEAKDPATGTLLEAHASELREAFRKIGLEPSRIDVERPAAARGATPRKPGGGSALDLRA